MLAYYLLSTCYIVSSDVQSANISFFNTTVSLYCVFAAYGFARGCQFVLSLTDGTWEEIDIFKPATGGNSQHGVCTDQPHKVHNYYKIVFTCIASIDYKLCRILIAIHFTHHTACMHAHLWGALIMPKQN